MQTYFHLVVLFVRVPNEHAHDTAEFARSLVLSFAHKRSPGGDFCVLSWTSGMMMTPHNRVRISLCVSVCAHRYAGYDDLYLYTRNSHVVVHNNDMAAGVLLPAIRTSRHFYGRCVRMYNVLRVCVCVRDFLPVRCHPDGTFFASGCVAARSNTKLRTRTRDKTELEDLLVRFVGQAAVYVCVWV